MFFIETKTKTLIENKNHTHEFVKVKYELYFKLMVSYIKMPFSIKMPY